MSGRLIRYPKITTFSDKRTYEYKKSALTNQLTNRTQKRLKNADILPGLYNLIKPSENLPFWLTSHARTRARELEKPIS